MYCVRFGYPASVSVSLADIMSQTAKSVIFMAWTVLFQPLCVWLTKENITIFSIISQHWDWSGSWNPSLWKTRIYLYYSQCHGCWCSGNWRSQSIISHDGHWPSLPRIFHFSSTRVNTLYPEWVWFHMPLHDEFVNFVAIQQHFVLCLCVYFRPKICTKSNPIRNIFNDRIFGSEHELRDRQTSWARSVGDQQPAGSGRSWSEGPWSLSWTLHPHLQHKWWVIISSRRSDAYIH